MLVKRPPASVVGLTSCRNLPLTLSFELNVWSILTISSRKLNTFFNVAILVNGFAAVTRFGCGKSENRSLTYAAATGSMDAAGMLLPYAWQGPAVPPLFAHFVQTT